MIDPTAIVQGVASGILTERVKKPVDKAIDQTLEIDNGKSPVEVLAEIHELMVLFYEYIKEQNTGKEDVYSYRLLYKSTVGPAFTPQHTSNRVHFQMFSATQIVLNVLNTALGTFNLTIPASTWTTIDYPDNASYTLDVSNSVNQITVYLRETNAQVV